MARLGKFKAFVVPWIVLVAVGCQSTPEPEIAAEDVVAAPADFRPALYTSRIHLDSGRYPNLFSPNTNAIWVEQKVAAVKLEQEAAAGVTISQSLESDARYVTENYHVFECYFESMFPDASIAYDVIGLRNLDIYLTAFDGTRIDPLQRILGSHADERARGALKEFSRTSVVVFPKYDLLTGATLIAPDAPGVRLVVEGFNSEFYFEWPALAETAQVIEEPPEGKLSFSSIYSRLRVLAQDFQ